MLCLRYCGLYNSREYLSYIIIYIKKWKWKHWRYLQRTTGMQFFETKFQSMSVVATGWHFGKKKPTDDHLSSTGACWIHLSTRNLLTFSVYESAYFYIIAFLLYKSETLSNKVLLHVSDMFS